MEMNRIRVDHNRANSLEKSRVFLLYFCQAIQTDPIPKILLVRSVSRLFRVPNRQLAEEKCLLVIY